jgi:ATP-dependent RNA circularization protein (DNA/RNA ligase family)
MKPTGFKNYGSIPHLSNSKLGEGDYRITIGQEKILTEKKRDKHDTIIVTEKYDGSNVGIAKVNGQIVAITRSGYEAYSSPYKQHHLFASWVYGNVNGFKELIGEGERMAGEWMAQAHGLMYNIDGCPFVLFDYFTSDNKRVTHDELLSKISDPWVAIKAARVIHKGDAIPTGELLKSLNKGTPEIKSIGDPEGMVYRVERHGKVDFLAKWVRSDFPTGKYIIDQPETTWNELI